MTSFDYVLINTNRSFTTQDVDTFIEYLEKDLKILSHGHKVIENETRFLMFYTDDFADYLKDALVNQSPVYWKRFSSNISVSKFIRELAMFFRCDAHIWCVDSISAYPRRDTSFSIISEDPRKVSEWYQKNKFFDKDSNPVRYEYSKMSPTIDNRPFEG